MTLYHGPDGLTWELHASDWRHPDRSPDDDVKALHALGQIPPGRTRTWTLEVLERQLLECVGMLPGCRIVTSFQWAVPAMGELPPEVRDVARERLRDAATRRGASTVLLLGWIEVTLP
jgi:hypothetical protein